MKNRIDLVDSTHLCVASYKSNKLLEDSFSFCSDKSSKEADLFSFHAQIFYFHPITSLQLT